MEIMVLASGSSGNAYTISDGTTTLLLDTGIPLKDIQRGIGFRASRLDGAFVTHEHKDHSKAMKDLARLGVDIYASKGTLGACGLSGHRFHPVEALKELDVGTFRVLPFDVEHDAAEPLGFMCSSIRTGERLLYFTDRDSLWEKVNAGDTPAVAAKRLFSSHMSLENFLDFLKANDLSRLQKIYICHMSNNHGNEATSNSSSVCVVGRQSTTVA